MTTLLFRQPDGGQHRAPPGHPERPARLDAIEAALAKPRFSGLMRRDAPHADLGLASLVHGAKYLRQIQAARPVEGIGQIDADTYVSAKSLEVAGSALGAGLAALEAVVLGEADNAFCAIRPPGHHAEIGRPMGFCLINTIAVIARQAQFLHGADRVAIIDFDVHHGNGTQDIFKNDPTVFYGSSHQFPFYPGTGAASETGVGNIVNAPLDAMTGTREMREAYETRILPALGAFGPDIILISAGFDAERRDPLAQLNWGPEDFAWVTGKIMDIADTHCNGRIVSLLEGGYDLDGLADGVTSHLSMLQDGPAS